MILYAITILISVFFAYTVEHVSISGKAIPEWVKVATVALPAILVTGLRYNIGTDYAAYKFAFENPEFVNVVKYFEINNRLFFKAINYFGGSFYTAVFVASIIFFIIVFVQIFEESPIPWLSTFLMFGLLFFFVYMNVTRQMIAISILFLSLRFIEQNKYIPFLACILFSSGIHRACILFVLILLLMRKEIHYKVVFWVTPIVFTASNLARSLIDRLASQLNYQVYLERSVFTMRSMVGLIWQIVITGMAYYAYNYYSNEEEQRRYRILLNVQILSLWSYAFIGFVRLNEVSRLQFMFRFPSLIFIPIIISRLPKKYMRLAAIAITIIYGIVNIYWIIYLNNEHGTLPYQSIFSTF